jgi:hypothetical protein
MNYAGQVPEMTDMPFSRHDFTASGETLLGTSVTIV